MCARLQKVLLLLIAVFLSGPASLAAVGGMDSTPEVLVRCHLAVGGLAQGTEPQVGGAATETQTRLVGTTSPPNEFAQGTDRAATCGDDYCTSLDDGQADTTTTRLLATAALRSPGAEDRCSSRHADRVWFGSVSNHRYDHTSARTTPPEIVATNSGSAVARAGCSFTPETLVLRADGTAKPISQVEVGDMVMAVDPETGERGPRKVTKLWEHEYNELVLVTVGGKTLKVTPNHPLWVVNRAEWVAAGDLRAGDLLLDDDGSTVRIGSVQRVLQRGMDVHNLTVDDIHTYFVVVGGSSLLVHNTGPLCGLADDYVDFTAKGSRFRNVQTGVSGSSFEQNLIDAGYKPTVVGSNNNVVSYELNGKRYVVRDAATSTGGPTADFYPAGSASFTLKIRLGG
jgi:hypothetical protein